MTAKGGQADPHTGREPCACVTNKDDTNTASWSVFCLHLSPTLHSHSKHTNRVIPLRTEEYVTPPFKNVPVFLSLTSNHWALPHLPFLPHLGHFFLLPLLIWYTGLPALPRTHWTHSQFPAFAHGNSFPGINFLPHRYMACCLTCFICFLWWHLFKEGFLDIWFKPPFPCLAPLTQEAHPFLL